MPLVHNAMVTERLLNIAGGTLQNIFPWERGREAERDLGALASEDWCTPQTRHKHTHLSSWNWAPVAGGGRWTSSGLLATHMFWVWSKRWPWMTAAFNTFATWCLHSWWTGDSYTTLLLDPCHLVSRAGRDSKGFGLPCTTVPLHGGLCHPAHHLPSAFGISVLQGCSAGACCVK